MLLQSKTRIMLKILVCAQLLMLTTDLCAEEEIDPDLQIHGFIAQGIVKADGSNFVNDDGELSIELTEVGLNGSYQLTSSVRLTGQVTYLEGGNRYNDGIRIDYALLDWSVYHTDNWQINLYAGRFKNYHWLYSGTRNVPFTRPSIILPQSMYHDGFRDTALGGNGGDLKISYSSDTSGNFDFNLSSGAIPLSKAQTQLVFSELALGRLKHLDGLQTSLYWQPAFSSWRFGLAFLDTSFEYVAAEEGDIFLDATLKLQHSTVNALYEGEKWEFAVEAFQGRINLKGFYLDSYHQEKPGQGYYAQFRYKIENSLTLLARYEKYYADKEDKNGQNLQQTTGGLVPSYFGYQHDITLGFSYDIAEAFRLQFEYHNFEGVARLTPVAAPNVALNNSKHWNLWAIQLMYWF